MSLVVQDSGELKLLESMLKGSPERAKKDQSP